MSVRDRRRSPRSVVGEFLNVEAFSGIVLVVATLAALVWANVSFSSYSDFWSKHLMIGPASFSIDESFRHWINDGLMTIFFFVVGLEVKRELVHGELRDPRTASLPVMGAIGGMVVPAVLFSAVNLGGSGSDGWAIPMATDIAFAVAIVAVLGSRVAPGARLFLLTLAIADDIGAILVIAVFYSEGISFGWLAGAVGVIVALLAMRRLRIASPLAYVVPALVLWVTVFESGVHATLAGVALGLLTPVVFLGDANVIERLEHRLHPWSSFLIVPVFALANTGILLGSDTIDSALGNAVTWGVIVGLVVGKPLGITLATVLATRMRFGRLPTGVRLTHIVGVGQLAGIGFTVSLFVAALSYEGLQLSDAKIGILVASTTSAVLGVLMLLRTPTRGSNLPSAPGRDEGAPHAVSSRHAERPTATATGHPEGALG